MKLRRRASTVWLGDERWGWTMIRIYILLVVLFLQIGPGISIHAQNPIDAADSEPRLLTDAELDLLLGHIALYPDPLIAVLLPAATQPGEIVMAVRYLNSGADPNLIDAQPWSDSVKALARYPDVLRWMDENLEWTTQVGHAFLIQPEDVMNTIQRLRTLAQSLGNLLSTPQQIVDTSEGFIDILPVDPDIVYVPVYQPYVVYTRPAAYGVGAYVTFRTGSPAGTWLKHDWDWRNRRVVIWSKDHFRPRNWWSQPRSERFKSADHLQEWCPHPRRGQGQSKWWASRRQQIEIGRTVQASSKGNQVTASRPASSGGRSQSSAPQVNKPLPAVIH